MYFQITQHVLYIFLLISVVCSNSFAQKPEIVVNSGHNDYILSLDISSDNKYVISGSMDNTIKLWEKESGRLIRTLYHGDGEVYLVFFIEDNSQIVSCGGNDTIRIWDLQSGELINTFSDTGYLTYEYYEDPRVIYGVSFSSDQGKIIAVTDDILYSIYRYKRVSGC